MNQNSLSFFFFFLLSFHLASEMTRKEGCHFKRAKLFLILLQFETVLCELSVIFYNKQA